jgi:hypothetical protein
MGTSANGRSLREVVSFLLEKVDWLAFIATAGTFFYLRRHPLESPIAPLGHLFEGLLAALSFLALASLTQRLHFLQPIKDTLESLSVRCDHVGDVFMKEAAAAVKKQDVIDSAREELWLTGITLSRSLETYQQKLVQKLLDGVEVCIILVAAEERLAEELRARSRGILTAEDFRRKLEHSARVALSIRDVYEVEAAKRAPKPKGKLSIGYLRFMPSFGVTLADPKSSEFGRGLVEVYHHAQPLNGSGNANFHITARGGDQWFDEYRVQVIDVLWRAAQPGATTGTASPPEKSPRREAQSALPKEIAKKPPRL